MEITALVQRQAEDSEAGSDIESGINAIKVGGQPLPESTRNYFEPRFGYNFSKVKVHTDSSSSNIARSINAEAFTLGQNIFFNSEKYKPESDQGKFLIAHELTHVVQQKSLANNNQEKTIHRTQTVTLKVKRGGKRTSTINMQVVIGELRFEKAAMEDVLKSGALLPSADQAHIGFYGDKLGYDPTYTQPTDPFRWNKLKDLIDSDQKILVMKRDLLGPTKVLFIYTDPSTQTVKRMIVDDQLRAFGLTLVTEKMDQGIYPISTSRSVSPILDTAYIYYTTALGSPADSSLAHEMFGHLWLAIKGVPCVHPDEKNPAEVRAQGTLGPQHNILDPFGNVYSGTVRQFINQFVGSERGALSSPTQNVGPQLLQVAMTAFTAGFSAGTTGTLNNNWSVSSSINLQWEIISKNFALAPATNPAAQPSSSTSPASQPAAASQTAITQATILQSIVSWYSTLNPDEQYIFLKLLEDISLSPARKSELASQLLHKLTRPQGMKSTTIFSPP